MKKVRVLNLLSLLFNLLIIGGVVYPVAVLIGSKLFGLFPRFDILASMLLAAFALISIPFNFRGKKLPSAIYVLKLVKN